MGRRRTRRAFSPSLGERISVSRRQRGASLHGYVAVSAAPHGCSNVFLHTSSPARPLSSQMAAPSRSESGLEVATRRVRIRKRTRSSHSSARPHRLNILHPQPVPPPSTVPYTLRYRVTPPCSPHHPSSIHHSSPTLLHPIVAKRSARRTNPFMPVDRPTLWASCARVLVVRPTSRARLHRVHHNTMNSDAF